MSTQQDPIARTDSKRQTVLFAPDKRDPAAAAKFVHELFKQKPHTVDIVSTELAPLYGFGPNSRHDVLARSRAQAVFNSPEVDWPLAEFLLRAVGDYWGVRTADWDATMAIVRKYRAKEGKKKTTLEPTTSPLTPEGFAPPNPAYELLLRVESVDELEHHYGRFLVRMLEQLERPLAEVGSGASMLKWLRDAVAANREEDVCWVLFHAAMYFQLKNMDINRTSASLSDVARHYVEKMKAPGSFSSRLLKIMKRS